MFIMIVSSLANIYITIEYRSTMPKQVQSIVQDSVRDSLPDFDKIISNKVNTKVDSLNLHSGLNGYTPQFGVDYFNGRDGKDSISTQTTIIEKTIEQVPVDGKTPILSCNTSKNRWEVSYNNGDTWQISLDRNKKPVKCTI